MVAFQYEESADAAGKAITTVPGHFRGYWQRGGALQQLGGSHLFNALCHYRKALSLFQGADQTESMAKYATAVRAASAQVAAQLTTSRGKNCHGQINVTIADAKDMQKNREYRSAARTHEVCAWAFELVGDPESAAGSLIQAASCENDAQDYQQAAALAERYSSGRIEVSMENVRTLLLLLGNFNSKCLIDLAGQGSSDRRW